MSSLSNLYPCSVLITSVVWKSFSKSAKQRITFSSALISLGMSRTDLNPLNGLKMSARQATTKKKHKIALNRAEILTRDFALGGVDGDALDVNGIGGVLGHTENILAKHRLNMLNDGLL